MKAATAAKVLLPLSLLFSGAAMAQEIPDIGSLDNGIYNVEIADKTSSMPCVLMVGNYGFLETGRGYAGLACDFAAAKGGIPNAQTAKMYQVNKVSNYNIGNENSGLYNLSVTTANGKTVSCIGVAGNYGWLKAGRGYGGLTCDFTR